MKSTLICGVHRVNKQSNAVFLWTSVLLLLSSSSHSMVSAHAQRQSLTTAASTHRFRFLAANADEPRPNGVTLSRKPLPINDDDNNNMSEPSSSASRSVKAHQPTRNNTHNNVTIVDNSVVVNVGNTTVYGINDDDLAVASGNNNDHENNSNNVSAPMSSYSQWNAPHKISSLSNMTATTRFHATNTNTLLPHEGDQPDHWTVTTFCLFVGLAVALCVGAALRAYRDHSRKKRSMYQEIESLVV
jgi:hypothetical protein